MLTEDETEAIVLGLRYVDQRGDEVLAKAAAVALAKIGAVLSPAAKKRCKSIALPGPRGPGFPANAVDLRTFRAAIRSQRKLRIGYIDAKGARSKRVVWPIALGFMNEARVLLAWCEQRQAYRTFRTDRISAAEETGERYKARRAQLMRGWRAQMNLDETERFTPDRI
jgi:predicted DNA-binding transcriptional regulator YafY